MRERFLFPADDTPISAAALDEISDRAFEIAVFEAAKQELQDNEISDGDASVELTPRSADRGRDIVVRSHQGRSFFKLALGGQSKRNLYLECKLTSKPRLSLDHVAANIMQIEPEKNSVFLLVTNATLTPRALHVIETQCRRVGVQFLLIDATNISRCLPSLAVRTASGASSPLVSYQILREGQATEHYIIHFVFRAAAETGTSFGIKLHSTRDWIGAFDGSETADLDAGNITSRTLKIRPSGIRSPRSFHVALLIDGKRSLHEVSLFAGEDVAQLPLFASEMSRHLVDLRSRLSNHSLPRFLQIDGKGGSGKTRLLEELYQEGRAQGRRCMFAKILDDGAVILSSFGYGSGGKTLSEQNQISRFLIDLNSDTPSQELDLIFVDDVHNASAPVFHEIFRFASHATGSAKLLLAGRSDPSFRKPAYEAFTRQVKDSQQDDQIEQVTLGEMTDEEVQAALNSILPGEATGLFGLGGRRTRFRPVDLVHAVHSLIERNHVVWTDEEQLSLSIKSDEDIDYFSGDEVVSGILEYRYQHLTTVFVGDFRLAGLLEVLAVLQDPHQSFLAIHKIADQTDVSLDHFSLWLDIDWEDERAVFRHSTLQDFLITRFYGFANSPRCDEILSFAFDDYERRSFLGRAAFAYCDGEQALAEKLIVPFARTLRRVENISSLSLHEDDYNELATLLVILQSSARLRSRLIHRCIVARGYLNTHHRAFALGFIDNLKVTSLLDGIASYSGKRLTVAAVKQLMAHSLINSGDIRTALSLMHEVENILESEEPTPVARSIEFDMCDRLQSHYAHQSAFEAAQMFFFRARTCAHVTRSETLLNLSFSAEFHLKRYLDCEEGARLAERQLKHARHRAPRRAVIHAEVNNIVAEWTLADGIPDQAGRRRLMTLRCECEEKAFGHLVPRIDYLLGVISFEEWQHGSVAIDELDASIATGIETARQYGYGEYTWLMGSLDLLKKIEGREPDKTIEKKAAWLITHLHNLGLTFVAGEELCYQNTVVISNTLRALYEYSDQETAWRFSRKVTFSPLFLPRPEDQTKRIESVFEGRFINRKLDRRSIILSRQGYGIILV